MRKYALLPVAVCTLVLAATTTGFAAETGGCDSFPWPVKTELQWMKASDSEALKSSAKLPSPPAKAMTLSLEPMSAVTFPVAPTGRIKPQGDVYGGIVDFESPGSAPGLFQVTLQSPGWIDVVQNGKPLKPTAHSGKSDCDGVRKTLRFNLEAGPFTVQFSNLKKDSIKFAIRQAE